MEELKGKLKLTEEAKAFFIQCGIKGGSQTSQAKRKSSQQNGFAPCKNGKKRGNPKWIKKLQE